MKTGFIVVFDGNGNFVKEEVLISAETKSFIINKDIDLKYVVTDKVTGMAVSRFSRKKDAVSFMNELQLAGVFDCLESFYNLDYFLSNPDCIGYRAAVNEFSSRTGLQNRYRDFVANRQDQIAA